MQVPQTGPSNEDVKADLNLLFDLLKGYLMKNNIIVEKNSITGD
jgi:hypothetical protein